VSRIDPPPSMCSTRSPPPTPQNVNDGGGRIPPTWRCGRSWRLHCLAVACRVGRRGSVRRESAFLAECCGLVSSGVTARLDSGGLGSIEKWYKKALADRRSSRIASSDDARTVKAAQGVRPTDRHRLYDDINRNRVACKWAGRAASPREGGSLRRVRRAPSQWECPRPG